MTVKELKELLKDVDDSRIIVLSKDAEGNGYEELRIVDDNSTFDASEGAIGIENLTKEYKEQGYTEEDQLENGVCAVVLWP